MTKTCVLRDMPRWQQEWSRRGSCRRPVPLRLSGALRPCVFEGEHLWLKSFWSLSCKYVVFISEFSFLERPLEALTLSPDIVPKFKRLWSWPEISFNGPLRAQLHKEEGVLRMSSSCRGTLWAERQWYRMAFACEEVTQLLFSTRRTRNEQLMSEQVFCRF